MKTSPAQSEPKIDSSSAPPSYIGMGKEYAENVFVDLAKCLDPNALNFRLLGRKKARSRNLTPVHYSLSSKP